MLRAPTVGLYSETSSARCPRNVDISGDIDLLACLLTAKLRCPRSPPLQLELAPAPALIGTMCVRQLEPRLVQTPFTADSRAPIPLRIRLVCALLDSPRCASCSGNQSHMVSTASVAIDEEEDNAQQSHHLACDC
jgi:hypothetical protein